MTFAYAKRMMLVMANADWNNRPRRESVRKTIGKRKSALIDQRDGGLCVYCGRSEDETGRRHHLDHLEAKSTGGTYDVRNLATSCERCNSTKKAMTERQWQVYAQVHLGLSFSMAKIRRHCGKLPA